MSGDMVDLVIRTIEWLAAPLVYGVLLILFFFFFVRPFFAYIFDPERIATKKIVDEKRKRTDAALEFNEIVDIDDLTIDPEEDIPDFITDDDKIQKLASSNPERGGDLVKQWLHSDQ